MANKKTFFRERSPEQIFRLKLKEIASPQGLVDRVLELGDGESIAILFPGLTPRKYDTVGDSVYASRNHLRTGFYAPLSQPGDAISAMHHPRRPCDIRNQDLTRKTSTRDEGAIFCLGYSFASLLTGKRTYVPFWSIIEGCLRDSYELTVCANLPELFRTDSDLSVFEKGAQANGAVVEVQVPSSEEHHSRYLVKFEHVPILDNIEKKIIGWNTTSECNSNPHEFHNFRVVEPSKKIVEPQEVHAYHKVIRHYLEDRNAVPFEMSQFAIPSRLSADFYRKLLNNVVIYDPSYTKNQGFRKLHVNELSVLTARLVGRLGVDATLFWNGKRDGPIKDYPWTI